MIDAEVLQQLRRGSFARVKLSSGLVVAGYAAADPEDAQFVRLDSLTAEDDGSLGRLSLRLRPREMEVAEVLRAAPHFQDANGSAVEMPAAFWPDL